MESSRPLNAQVPLATPPTQPEAAPPKPKSHFRVILAVILIVLLIIVAGFAFFDFRAIVDTVIGATYQPSSEMATVIDHIELTDKGNRILKASKAELQNADDFNSNCVDGGPVDLSVLGCYVNWRIYLYDIDNEELDGIKEAVLAHELLHAVWHREKSSVKSELEPLLREQYKAHQSEFEDHMKTYSSENVVDELHSVVGTQVDPSSLPQKLRDHYASIFKNHQRIIAYYDKYNEKFVTLKKSIEEASTKIAQMKADIKTKTEGYRQRTTKLNNDIDTFNRNAENGYYSGNSAAFQSDREALVMRQDLLNNEYQEIVKLVDETNALIEQYNKDIARSSELYGSINSQIKKVEGVTK